LNNTTVMWNLKTNLGYCQPIPSHTKFHFTTSTLYT